jgi:hypothetical protein
MNARLILSALSAAMIVTGCAHHREYAWFRADTTKQDRELALKTAHAEAVKAYPSTAKLKPPPKNPVEGEERLAEMRRSVEALYLSAHGWHHVYYDRKGRMYEVER